MTEGISDYSTAELRGTRTLLQILALATVATFIIQTFGCRPYSVRPLHVPFIAADYVIDTIATNDDLKKYLLDFKIPVSDSLFVTDSSAVELKVESQYFQIWLSPGEKTEAVFYYVADNWPSGGLTIECAGKATFGLTDSTKEIVIPMKTVVYALGQYAIAGTILIIRNGDPTEKAYYRARNGL